MTDETTVLTPDRLAEIRKRAEQDRLFFPSHADSYKRAEDMLALLAALEAAQEALAEQAALAVKAQGETDEARARRNDALASLSAMTLKRDALATERDAGVLERANLAARLAEVDAALASKRAPRHVDAPAPKLADEVAELIRRVETAERSGIRDAARVAELEGIRPELPPRPPGGSGLPRYSLRWNGPDTPLSVPMADGYWTPYHLAAGRVAELEGALAAWRAMRQTPSVNGSGSTSEWTRAYMRAEELLDRAAAPPEQAPRTDDATPPADALLRVAQGFLRVWDEKNGDGNTLAPEIPEAVAALRRVVERPADVGAAPPDPVQRVLEDVRAERARQDAKWGTERIPLIPDGTGDPEEGWGDRALEAKRLTDEAMKAGRVTYRMIAEEEIAEAFAECDPGRLRAELVQCAAVFAKWIQAIDTRAAPPASTGTAPDLAQLDAPTRIQVTDPHLDAPDGARIVLRGWWYGRHGSEWVREEAATAPDLARFGDAAIEEARKLAQAGDPLCAREGCGHPLSEHDPDHGCLRPDEVGSSMWCPCPGFVAPGAGESEGTR